MCSSDLYMEEPDAFIQCAWPGAIDLVNAGGFAVSVLDLDGTPQPISYTVDHTGGVLRVSITGFHYSRPTIRIQALVCDHKASTRKGICLGKSSGGKGKPTA